MNADEWQRVRELFERALDESPRDLPAWIERQAGGDSTVRAELRSLLEHHARAGAFLDQAAASALPALFADEDALPAGTTVGPYTILRELGRGGMGQVYAAKDERLGRVVALKALGPAVAHDATHRARLRREAQAAAALTHPGICTVYALEEIDGQLFIASELVEGQTLRHEMTGRRPSRDESVRTARELAAALASAHAGGITHRDLKPENVMRANDGRLKILDFGLARMATPELPAAGRPFHLTVPGMLVGTPAYMAPEQLNGQPSDPRTDVFAYGVMMYEYACGEHPFAAATPLATLARVLESQATPISMRLPDLPIAFCRTIERCMQKAAAERFQSAGEIVAALDGIDLARPIRHSTWWRVHQLALMALYVVASTIAWSLKESFPGALSLWLFVALGFGSAIAGMVRGHWLFTEAINRPRLGIERRRAARVLTTMDLLIAALLGTDALLVASVQPLRTVFTIALAVGIALAAVLMEPATTAAVFGEE